MGSSCSSKKGHKDKDSVSTKSEESTAYQANVKKHPDADPKVSEDQKNHSEVDLKHEDPKATAKPGRIPTSSVSDTMSLPSPPTQSPRELPEPSLPKEILELPESNQNLITGRGLTTTTNFKARKIILYVCAADSEEFSVEKAVFHDVIVPELRNYCREKGYELHVTDLHWKNDLEKLSSHEFSDLCLSELNRQKELGHLIPVLFLSNTIGTILLPKSIETQDFKATLKKTNEKETLKKWYQVDSDAQPSCFRFSLVGPLTSGTKETAEEKERASKEWNSEIDTLLNTLITNFPDEMKNNYLTTVVEQEVQNAISTSIDTGRRCLWLYRFFTQRPEPIKSENLIEGEQKRRLEALLNNLRGQLTEKHIIRMNVKWNQDGVIDKDIPEHAQYINTFTSYFIKYLKAVIFNIIEEDQSKVIVRSIFGIDAQLLKELKWQAVYFDKVSQITVNRDKIFQELEDYVTGDAQHPLLIHGVQGSGKSAVLYKIIKNIQTWLPDSYLVFRFTKISDLSHNLIDILKTICDQLSVINSGHLTICNYTISNFGKLLMKLISSVALQKPVIIIIDGLDHINITEMDWMPWKLPSKAKIIVSARTDSFVFHQFKSNIENNKFLINIPEFGKAEATGLLLSSVVQYSLCRHSVSLKVSNNVVSALKSCLLPLYLNVLAWRISWFGEITNEFKPMNSVNEEINFFLDLVDAKLGKDRVKMALSLISASKYGLTDSELCEILSREPIFHSDQFSLKWAPTLVFLGNFLKYLNPFLHWVSDGDNLTLKIKDTTFDEIIKQRHVQQNNLYNNLIQSYFKGFGLNEKSKNSAEKCSNQSKTTVKYYSKRKFIELPYQSILLNNNPTNEYLLNSSWLFEKICGCGVFQVIDDIVQFSSKSSLSKDLEILKSILENTHYALNYDGRQMYTQFREELKQMKLENGFWKSFFEETEIPPSKSLVPVTKIMPRAGDFEESASENLDQIDSINLIVRLIDNPNFVVSVSTEKEEIAVWNLCSGEKVRCIKGVTHPISLQLIDDVRAVVLCRRELRIYNLDEGVLVTKLKGVMNQKMAYFGLHDKNHVVTLSRNRMYVNLMHLKTGDCITTFKAGEDRFLNSLLVSGDGRILVCGDETQKPFPLLVWNLSSRKLLYDLRIPHHDFITSLSAITHEGHYVCCVAKEVVEPGPNFIVVYDLQNGTLFKKWKPGVDTTSLDISSKDSCVISGLADARILVWDLVTGNCRWSLRGHSAPVTLVRRDPCGGTFLSADVLNRDRSLRLWDLNKGELLAVYTPPKPFSACELGIGGKIIALSLQGEEEVKSLILKGPGIDPVENNAQYGETGNHGKTFILSENQGARFAVDGKCSTASLTNCSTMYLLQLTLITIMPRRPIVQPCPKRLKIEIRKPKH